MVVIEAMTEDFCPHETEFITLKLGRYTRVMLSSV